MVDSTTQFEVLQVLDLLHHDNHIETLYQTLRPWQTHVFTDKQKIVLLHNDTEYFLPGVAVGFTMHNIMNLWRYLDLPWHAMLLVTNHHDYERAVAERRCFVEQDRPTVIHNIVNNCSWRAAKNWLSTPNTREPKFPALSLMATQRSHRLALWQYIQKQGLGTDIAVNFGQRREVSDRDRYGHDISDQDRMLHHDMMLPPILSDLPFGTVHSWPHRINEDFFANCQHPDLIELSNHAACDHQDHRLQGDIDDFYADFFCDIVTETVFDYPHVFISEKTLRPLLRQKPFMILGAPGTLKVLRDHGFETFGDLWDESYDDVPDPALRFLRFCSSMKHLVTRSQQQLNQIYQDLQPRLTHNRTMIMRYINQQFLPLYQKLGFTL